MRSCSVVGCSNRHNDVDEKGNRLSFYSIPLSDKPFERNRRELWLRAIHRENWPKEMYKNGRVCSAHFGITGM